MGLVFVGKLNHCVTVEMHLKIQPWLGQEEAQKNTS